MDPLTVPLTQEEFDALRRVSRYVIPDAVRDRLAELRLITQKLGGMGADPGRRNAGACRAMTKTPKRPRDPNQLAKAIVDIATGGPDAPEPSMTVKRARSGGEKGGPARAKILTPQQRSEIASIAAQARWKKS